MRLPSPVPGFQTFPSHFFDPFSCYFASMDLKPKKSKLFALICIFRICKLEGNQAVNFYFFSSLEKRTKLVVANGANVSSNVLSKAIFSTAQKIGCHGGQDNNKKITTMEIHNMFTHPHTLRWVCMVCSCFVHTYIYVRICVQVWILGQRRVYGLLLYVFPQEQIAVVQYISSGGYVLRLVLINCSYPCPIPCGLSFGVWCTYII